MKKDSISVLDTGETSYFEVSAVFQITWGKLGSAAPSILHQRQVENFAGDANDNSGICSYTNVKLKNFHTYIWKALKAAKFAPKLYAEPPRNPAGTLTPIPIPGFWNFCLDALCKNYFPRFFFL